jgi:hypothetical protein
MQHGWKQKDQGQHSRPYDPEWTSTGGNVILDIKAAAVPRAAITSWTWCNGSSGIETAGFCTFSLGVAHGVAPHSAKFVVWKSNVPNDSTIYDWGSTEREIYVAHGDYELTVKAWVQDAAPFSRLGSHFSIQQIPVCTEDALLGPACGGSED